SIKGVPERALLRIVRRHLPGDHLKLIPGRGRSVAYRHLYAFVLGPGLNGSRATVATPRVIAPVADRDRKQHPGPGVTVKPVEDVGAVDGKWILVLVDDADDAAISGSAIDASRLGLLVVVLDPQAAHLQVVLRVQAAADGGEVVEPVGGDHPGVFDPHATKSHQIEPRLDGDHVPCGEGFDVRPSDAGLLVHVQADPVAGAVVHLRSAIRPFVAGARGAVAAVDKDLANRVVHIAS